MAGHSKWANIKHRKGRADAKKGKIFSRAAKEIISAVKEGGPDPKGNPRLRLAIDKAKSSNVPNDIIDRNIKKASSADQADYEELSYEIYGFGGVGIYLDIMTDNRNRIASEIRIAINKKGGTIANPGSVAYNFDRMGVIQVSKENTLEDDLLLVATDAGAEDFDETDDAFVILTDPTTLYQVKEEIVKQGYTCMEASLEMIPKVTVEVDKETGESNEALIERLEEIEDVDSLFHNMAS
ncbi:MAG: YebC/PmpR family DNA-binding transcriptional regulator [Waddliaceae bacterium]